MGKKREDVPSVNMTANRDIIQRLNYLYQASFYLQSIALQTSTSGDTEDNVTVKKCASDLEMKHSLDNAKRKMKPIGKRKTSNDLARNYIHCMKLVALKTTVKMSVFVLLHGNYFFSLTLFQKGFIVEASPLFFMQCCPYTWLFGMYTC